MDSVTSGAMGTTSAHAENTSADRKVAGWKRNYLRARGEYCLTPISETHEWELPPRTRRIPAFTPFPCFIIRTTSVHAENTSFSLAPRLAT